MLSLRKRLTYANTMSSIAVFVALGGGAYAATQLQKNSVGTAQLKADSVTAAKVKNGSLLSADFKAGQLPAGPAGPKGDPGAPGAAGAPGAKGDTGESFPATLPSGKTLTGIWGFVAEDNGAGNHEAGADSISFTYPLASDPAVTVVQLNDPPPVQCPGTLDAPAAAPGNLCIFVGVNVNGDVVSTYSPTGDGKHGVVVFANGLAGGRIDGGGSWAVSG